MPANDTQTWILDRLKDDPFIMRMECRPLADESIEAWCFGPDDTLLSIRTVFKDGRMAVRPGFRPTTETWIGDPPDAE